MVIVLLAVSFFVCNVSRNWGLRWFLLLLVIVLKFHIIRVLSFMDLFDQALYCFTSIGTNFHFLTVFWLNSALRLYKLYYDWFHMMNDIQSKSPGVLKLFKAAFKKRISVNVWVDVLQFAKLKRKKWDFILLFLLLFASFPRFLHWVNTRFDVTFLPKKKKKTYGMMKPVSIISLFFHFTSVTLIHWSIDPFHVQWNQKSCFYAYEIESDCESISFYTITLFQLPEIIKVPQHNLTQPNSTQLNPIQV